MARRKFPFNCKLQQSNFAGQADKEQRFRNKEMVIFEVMTRTFDHIILFIGPDHIRNCKMRLSIEHSVHIFEESH